jgi:hypothetical protein
MFYKKITPFTAIGILLFATGCINIYEPYGKGNGTGQICAHVESDEKGAHGIVIEAVGIGGDHALEKYSKTISVEGPFDKTEICVGVPGNPDRQEWQIRVTVTNPGRTEEKVFTEKTYNY